MLKQYAVGASVRYQRRVQTHIAPIIEVPTLVGHYKGPNMLNYRRYPLAKIPEKYRELVKPYVMDGKDPAVVVLDNRLDAHFGNLEGWFGDRHPNLAGYRVIADETAKYLAPLLRERAHGSLK